MAVRPVLRVPHPGLKRVARAVLPDEVEAIAVDLVDTMRAHPRCVGVAAPQLGEPVRMVAVDVTGHPKATSCHGMLVLANPRITASEGAEVGREGCLSIPELTANVRRAVRVTVESEGRDPIDAEGFEARCLQHELDHLDGILFLDRVDSLSTDVFRRRAYG